MTKLPTRSSLISILEHASIPLGKETPLRLRLRVPPSRELCIPLKGNRLRLARAFQGCRD